LTANSEKEKRRLDQPRKQQHCHRMKDHPDRANQKQSRLIKDGQDIHFHADSGYQYIKQN
jgi:hypothetical protein